MDKQEENKTKTGNLERQGSMSSIGDEDDQDLLESNFEVSDERRKLHP